MVTYQNLGGDSGVVAYQIGSDSIEVRFSDGSCYLYTYLSAGNQAIEKMKALAIAGQGLNSYISTIVKMGYASKRTC